MLYYTYSILELAKFQNAVAFSKGTSIGCEDGLPGNDEGRVQRMRKKEIGEMDSLEEGSEESRKENKES